LSTSSPPDTLTAALAMAQAGCSVVPVRADGSKAPAAFWTKYQTTRATEYEIRSWLGDGSPGVGVVTGEISGNLEMFEAEGRAVEEGVYAQFVDIITASGLADTWNRIVAGWFEKSPSGGLHALFRVDGTPVLRNTKLASRPSTEAELADNPKAKVQVLFETRGERGFTVTAPSHGTVHPSGRPWELVSGGAPTMATISAGEYEALHAIARMVDQMPTPDPAPAAAGQVDPEQEAFFRSGPTHDGISPGDDFEARTDWAEILTPHGWTLLGQHGQTRYWARPGKTDPGPSATTGRDSLRDRLYVFTTSTDFDAEIPYTKFGAHAVLNHGGDHKAAARELRRTGYGTPPPQPARHLAAVPPQPAGGPGPQAFDGSAALQISAPAVRPGSWPPSFTDDGNALLFVDHMFADLRYVPERGEWLVWEGHRWAWDKAGRAVEHGRRILRDLDPSVFNDEDMEKAARKHKGSSLGRDRIRSMLGLAQSDYRVVARAADLDAAPRHLNTPAGIVDLETGTVAAPDPAALHTRSTSLAPDPACPTPRWTRFLSQTFGDNTEMIAFVQRLAGYSASADTGIHVLPFLHGAGQNGKSVLMDVLRHLLGDYAAPAPAGFLMVGKQEHSEEMARLQGLRLVVASEVNQDARFDEAKMKELTGGDTITARFMRQSFFSFDPTHHLWLMGNHQPTVKAGGESFWRRLRLLSFQHRVPDDQKVENLARILVDEEGPGILAWMVQGACEVFTGGLREPAQVMSATRAYADEEDQIGRFFEECCLIGGGDQVRLETKRLRSAYESWCHSEGDVPIASSPFGREIKQRGITQVKSTGKRLYVGVALISTDEEEPRWDER
jgi:P4 family phage/plasmid primase-like protien